MVNSGDELDTLAEVSSPFKDFLRGYVCGEVSDDAETQRSSQLGEDEGSALFADVALAPSCGRCVSCSCPESSQSREHPDLCSENLELQLQFFLNRADDLRDNLVNENSHLDREDLAAAVSSLLYTCQPFFNHLESTGRSAASPFTNKPAEICSKLLDFSQQLCDRLEQLMLTYASYDLISLDEAEPNSISHFCVGQVETAQMRLTTFLYCKPTPYLSRVHTGVFKRMRWNVERLHKERRRGGTDREEDREEVDTDFYFLCYEEIPNAHAEPESGDDTDEKVVRMWSIGQWVQVNPEPSTEDLYDWILCEVPEARYRRLLFLGPDEPPSITATEYLQQLLLSPTDPRH